MSSTRTTQSVTTLEIERPRRACEVVSGKYRATEALFDVFWSSGELALLFGEPGAGKSVLAMEIADALARGRRIDRFEMPRRRQKVLYVDLVLSDRQFAARYEDYKLSRNVFRDTPPDTVGLVDRIRKLIAATGTRVVVIDDLSMVSRTDDGTRETLELMRELRRMTVELGVSVLVLADSFPNNPDREIAEKELRRSRVLCGVADSVFALGTGSEPDGRELVQMRVRSGDLVWPRSNPAECSIKRRDDGMLAMEFDLPEMDRERRDMVLEIKEMHDEDGMTFREIAVELDISKSHAQRLYTEWRPDLARAVEVEQRDRAEREAHEAELEAWKAEGGLMRYDYDQQRWVKAPKPDGTEPPAECEPNEWNISAIPFAAGLGRRLITDLERMYDADGNEIFVEKWEEHTGKPKVWYKREREGYRRMERDTFGISITRLGRSAIVG